MTMAYRSTFFALLCCTSVVTALPAVSAPDPHKCDLASCWPDCGGDNVTMTPYNVTISKWNSDTGNYSYAGTIVSHALQQTDKGEFGIFLHGPYMRPEDTKPGQLPPVYFSSSFMNKVYKVDGITSPLNGDQSNWSSVLTDIGDAVAPSTTYPITDGPNGSGKLNGFLVAEGNPFYGQKVNGSMEMTKGGVTYMGAQNKGTQCNVIFPRGVMSHLMGQVVNTVDCHVPTGMCFFSVWKFYDDSLREWAAPDCLYYCKPDDMSNPTDCINSGVLRYDDGSKVCSTPAAPNHMGGGVHGFTVGNTDPTDSSKFDLLLVMTGEATFDMGVSSMKKLKVQVMLDSVKTLQTQIFGSDLWSGTVPPCTTKPDKKTCPHDVGLDHAWVDVSRTKVWVTSFRKYNPGLHLLDYETGKLYYSIRGFDQFFGGGDKYIYPAGLSGMGQLGTKGSLIAMATSTQKGLTVPPIFDWGLSAFFLVDISAVLNATNATEFA